MRTLSLLTIALVLTVVLAVLYVSRTVPAPVIVEVIKVVDGDTIDVRLPPTASARLHKTSRKDINVRRVRLLDIDAPEMRHGKRKPDYWAEQSKEALDNLIDVDCVDYMVANSEVLVDNRLRVTLEFSRVQGLRGKFNRLLAFVWVRPLVDQSAILVQEYMVRNGHARVLEKYGLDPRYRKRLFAAQEQAKAEGLGIWSRK